ncbi:wall-associated receptor kinase 2-like [Juglans microcarpa x Juglans regia]|uniref:wall-associated receptor kinase 2-like n=1 Tax=Juglans microcarpa x Juglans regia TaxID=2249226 RepID=UPI001B7E9A60|nr:wall-associated receptor kinase 2-like [Juglans microcarpa x Juglans regia]
MGGYNKLLVQVIWVGVILSRMATAAPATATTNGSALPNCPNWCGDVEIPYPFGIGEGCSLNKSFSVDCTKSSDGLRPWKQGVVVQQISIQGQIDIFMNTVEVCNNGSGLSTNLQFTVLRTATDTFTISNTQNVFVAVGCDTYAFLDGNQNNGNFSMGCMSICQYQSNVLNGTCSGIGCCQVEIPERVSKMTLRVYSFNNHTKVLKFNPCGYAFVVKKQLFNFSSVYLSSLQNNRTIPMVLDWTIGNERCKYAQLKTDYICGGNSTCDDPENGYGYRCQCNKGYEGNPYLPLGCKDIDECISLEKPCAGRNARCINTDGSYTCTCQHGFEGDGQIGCRKRHSKIIPIALGASTCLGVLFLLIGGWGSYKVVKKRKRIQRRQEFFKRNGGLLLQQQISQSELNVENTKLFNSKDLERATDHFNVNRILGQGGQGTVYKGMLDDGRIVAVKKSKITNEGKLREFINEVVVLSRINHRNIVKLLGCCLETEVPLLVYEFVPNGTLSKYLSDQIEEFPLTWDMRLRIATEIAGALYYLHSEASLPIYHRDIKSTNILLDDKYRAKVADFGTSRSVAIDQTHLTTLVHGTFGYLDPEYFQSSQFTEKSDVYSFGVVLVELLTGEKAISLTRAPESKGLASYFISSMEENNLFDILDKRILMEAVEEELIAVANVAKRCLSLDGKKRPMMKEVSMELEAVKISQKASSLEMCKRDYRPTVKEVVVMLDGLRGKGKQTRKEANLNTEETEHLLSASTQYSLNIDVGVGYSSTSTI